MTGSLFYICVLVTIDKMTIDKQGPCLKKHKLIIGNLWDFLYLIYFYQKKSCLSMNKSHFLSLHYVNTVLMYVDTEW